MVTPLKTAEKNEGTRDLYQRLTGESTSRKILLPEMKP